ncbi:glycosyltransferase family 2 protein [Herbaspirillum sp. DW155]|uniref:glycosyltransferase family 2 protein n=1 Tax=Herbaspirillum sp. DW155 TaxID=3095609 RepID=UPI0030CACF80
MPNRDADTGSGEDAPVIAVVIPSYKVTRHILGVIEAMGEEISLIYVVDDKCPDGSGDFVAQHCNDPRVRIVRHEVNQGVGGAVMSGYKAAVADGADVIVKVDGDGQMDPELIPHFVRPILDGVADYTKGNRFYDLEEIGAMPPMRLFGNTVLSLMAKFSTGYWDLFDPTNGFTAIHADVARHLPYDKISRRYFFETDMLFRLNILRAAVVDIPMAAKYGDEVSGLKISKIVGEFLVKHARNFVKRIFYNYYLRDLTLASLELPIGLLLLGFGIGYGGYHWIAAAGSGLPTPAGTVMMAALPILTGLQLVLAFLGHDIAAVPRRARHLGRLRRFGAKPRAPR